MQQGRGDRLLRVSFHLKGTDLLDEFLKAIRHMVPLSGCEDAINPKHHRLDPRTPFADRVTIPDRRRLILVESHP
jgi:hypothetical protein